MKKLTKLILITIFLLGVLFIKSPTALAQTNFRNEENITLNKDDVVNDNYFAAGQYVNLDGIVNGDAYLAGSNITVNGTVNGDVFAAGGSINIKGKVLGNIRSTGGQINISGEVGKNVLTLGGQIILNNNSKVAGSLTAAGGNIEINTPINKSIQVAAGTLTIANIINGNVTYAGERLVLANNAVIKGDLTYYSDNDVVINSGSAITGQVTKHLIPQNVQPRNTNTTRHAVSAFFGFWSLISFISALVLGLLLIRLFPNLFLSINKSINEKFLNNLGVGLLTVILTPAIMLVLIITVMGIPLAFILLMIFILFLYIAKLFTALYIGRLITLKLTNSQSLVIAYLIGLIIYYFIGIIPLFGWLLQTIFNLAAIGALIFEGRNLYKTAHIPSEEAKKPSRK
jgi:cytoskeletal protein CcmA (bactofilin family)